MRSHKGLRSGRAPPFSADVINRQMKFEVAIVPVTPIRTRHRRDNGGALAIRGTKTARCVNCSLREITRIINGARRRPQSRALRCIEDTIGRAADVEGP
jgi:hypothetical protein